MSVIWHILALIAIIFFMPWGFMLALGIIHAQVLALVFPASYWVCFLIQNSFVVASLPYIVFKIFGEVADD